MVYLRKTGRHRKYYCIYRSKRINGKPVSIFVKYLGKICPKRAVEELNKYKKQNE